MSDKLESMASPQEAPKDIDLSYVNGEIKEIGLKFQHIQAHAFHELLYVQMHSAKCELSQVQSKMESIAQDLLQLYDLFLEVDMDRANNTKVKPNQPTELDVLMKIRQNFLSNIQNLSTAHSRALLNMHVLAAYQIKK